MNEYEAPYTFKEFYDHCKKFKCEELVDYVIAVYNYQSAYEFAAIQKDQETANDGAELQHDGVIRDRKETLSLLGKTKRLINKLSGRVEQRPKVREEVEVEKPEPQKSKNSKRNSSSKNMEQTVACIINTYIRSTSPNQINIPFHINDTLIKNYEGKMRGADLFEESLQHCEMILKTSPLPSFSLERKHAALKLR